MKKLFKTVLIIVAALIALVVLLALLNKEEDTHPYDPTENFSDFAWPDSELINRIPKPEKIYGEIHHEQTDSFSVDIGGVSREQYDDYVKACQDAGFVVDYSKSSTSYYAYDADGYYIHVTYDAEHTYMSISTRDPEEKTTTTATQKTDTTTTTKSASANKDFKTAMDDYEAFIDGYIAITQKYQANPTDMTIFADYTDYLNRYTEMCDAFAAWEDEDLSADELTYYIEVQTRVNKKLLEVAQ